MENAVSALKMAAAVLVFIIAIASSFSLFGTAKQTADSIIGMRDKQQYLEAAELDTVLYTSSEAISENANRDNISDKSDKVTNMTKNGDRIVSFADVVSTIYRYNKEKYGVTIVKSNGTVLARFDSNTENIMRNYNNISSGLDDYKETLEKNTKTVYTTPEFKSKDKLESLYKISDTGNPKTKYGAPWYGNEEEIIKRINVNINGGTYELNGQTYEIEINNSLKKKLYGNKIIEVTNEIDNSKYLEDTNEDNKTDLLQQYKMPTVEIIYIVYDN